ncbi:MAG: UDP-3-O-acyl-N-acetylglucosamine deacetylase [Parvibaculum sp.]
MPPKGFKGNQGTIAAAVSFEGVGLHTGRVSRVTVRPAPAGHGIAFCRTGGNAQGRALPAHWKHGIDFPRCTTLRAEDGTRFQTIEHLMAAFFALQIDNALVEMDGQEVPILDGSAAPIVSALEKAGRSELDVPRRFHTIEKTVELDDGRISLRIDPHPTFAIDFTLELPYWGTQRWSGDVSPESFRRDIAKSRTYGILSVIWPALILGKLRLIPLVRGASLDNALLMYKDRVLNKGGLHTPDEFLRHRILDLVGDLMLAGAPIVGKVTAFCSTHKHNRTLLAKIEETNPFARGNA